MATIVAFDDFPINKDENVEKEDAGIKNVDVASDHSRPISKEEDLETEAGIKNIDAFDSIISKKEDKKDAITKNVVASDRIIEEEVEKQKGIDLGLSMHKLNLGFNKKLLVLPISGMLVHRVHRSRPNTFPKNCQPDFCSGNFMIYKRPFCEGFLKFCFEKFEVGIWSSAMEHNIDGVLTNVFREHKNKLLFTWDQNQCTKTDFMCLDNKNKPVFLKELDRVWKKKRSYSASNTLMITDPVKALLNPPNTAISLGSYDPEHKEDNLLGPDGELRVFLDGLAEAIDVQTYVKDHPIGEPLITPSHADWKYYSKIIRAYGKNKLI